MGQVLKNSRNLVLDFVKGILVVIMVVYHVMNIFTDAEWEDYSYIRFVSGSFVCISGYIVAAFYETKFIERKITISKRLLIRGLKLVLLFTLLNTAIYITGVGNPNKVQPEGLNLMGRIFDVFVVGNPGAASFQILLPIGYVLMFSPACLLLRQYKVLMLLSALGGAFFISFLDIESVNLGLGILGIIGVFSGMVMNAPALKLSLTNWVFIVSGLLLGFYLMRYFDRNLLSYAFGIGVIIKLFYDLGSKLNLEQYINRALIMLGQYSLACYIAQIVLLQCLAIFVVRQKLTIGFETLAITVSTILLLVALSALLGYFRSRFKCFDSAYRLIFA